MSPAPAMDFAPTAGLTTRAIHRSHSCSGAAAAFCSPRRVRRLVP